MPIGSDCWLIKGAIPLNKSVSFPILFTMPPPLDIPMAKILFVLKIDEVFSSFTIRLKNSVSSAFVSPLTFHLFSKPDGKIPINLP